MISKITPEHEIRWPRRVLTAIEAVKFIDAAGYCMLFPVMNVPLPSLYFAVTRRNPHEKMVWDKYSAMVWNWKDELPRRRRAFYAKYFRGRGTFISLRLLPHFLAMRESAAAAGDHERFYFEGRITEDARVVWEALAEHGPLATLELRHACKMETKAGNKRFKRAILDLQRLLVGVHSGAEQETAAWASGRYDLTCRAFPQETSTALRIAPEEARRALAAKFVEWHPQATAAQLARLFGWAKDEAGAALASIEREETKSKVAARA
jgi:winged helix DNA-binding protein